MHSSNPPVWRRESQKHAGNTDYTRIIYFLTSKSNTNCQKRHAANRAARGSLPPQITPTKERPNTQKNSVNTESSEVTATICAARGPSPPSSRASW